jgi:hypothetical protein
MIIVIHIAARYNVDFNAPNQIACFLSDRLPACLQAGFINRRVIMMEL